MAASAPRRRGSRRGAKLARRGASLALGLTLGLGCLAALEGEAAASPGVDGTRNLSMGNATRGSSAGTNAALINPAGLVYSQQFAIEPVYQYDLQTRTHGLGAVIADSLNTPRFALALSYVFMRGGPRLLYNNALGDRKSLELVHFGHEVAGSLAVVVVKNWLYFGLKPKWQYVSLRYLDDEGVARDFNPKLNTFGLDAAIALNIVDFVRIAVVGYNLVGPRPPAWTEDGTIELEGVAVSDTPDYNTENIRRVSDYPRSLGHGLAVFPLRNPNFSLNVDATYDFTSYWQDNKWTRITVNAGGEFVAGPVPIRVGGWWDRRGRGAADDRGYVTAGVGYVRPAPVGGAGVDVGFGFAQQVTGATQAKLDTIMTLNVGIRLHPDL
ncbi:MAG: hypothetical protein KC457_20900, partial [Myxococcales bacterium]|nr:hypothetical protein [Myxococcales bacterium]